MRRDTDFPAAALQRLHDRRTSSRTVRPTKWPPAVGQPACLRANCPNGLGGALQQQAAAFTRAQNRPVSSQNQAIPQQMVPKMDKWAPFMGDLLEMMSQIRKTGANSTCSPTIRVLQQTPACVLKHSLQNSITEISVRLICRNICTCV